ncbi:hypothetical protein OFC87_31560, partial [Escherichia coli]|nr:hypothetical protein [Escherichia coli]
PANRINDSREDRRIGCDFNKRINGHKHDINAPIAAMIRLYKLDCQDHPIVKPTLASYKSLRLDETAGISSFAKIKPKKLPHAHAIKTSNDNS